MSDTHCTHVPDQHSTTHATGDAHGAAAGDAHGGGHGHDAHGGEALGPIDWTMWGVGVLGVVAALIVVAGFVAATDFSFVA
jgi:hypothetical protein